MIGISNRIYKRMDGPMRAQRHSRNCVVRQTGAGNKCTGWQGVAREVLSPSLLCDRQ